MIDKKQEHDSFSLEKLKSGDREEFARLVELYSDKIYRLGYKMLGNAQDAEDILQETFVKAFQHLGGFDGRSSISTWLYRIATNESLMYLRKHKKTELSIDETLWSLDPEQEPMEIVDFCCLPENELLSAESREYLDSAIEQLTPALRVVFILRDIEDLSTKETADVLGLTETAVKTRLSRARLRLRQLLSKHYGEHLKRQIDVQNRLSAEEKV